MGIDQVRIRQDGDKVLFHINGKVVEMGWKAGLRIADSLRSVAKLAEEYDSHQRIIEDGAILLKKGIPLGLTNNPLIQKEIAKEAAWGRWNKYLGGGIKSEAHVGTPTLVQDPRPRGNPEIKNGGNIK